MTTDKIIDVSEGAALASRVVAAILTVILFGSAYAAEQNTVTRILIEETGFVATTLISLGSVAAVYAIVRRLAATDDAWLTRAGVGGAVLGAGISVADAVNNLYVLYTTGLPEGLPSATPVVALVATAGAAVLVAKPDPRPTLRRLVEAAPRPTVRQVATVAFTAMLVTSGVGGVVQFGVGTAEAAEGDGEVWNQTIDGTNAVADMDVNGGIVYALDGDAIKAYNPSTGSLKWTSAKSNYGFYVAAGPDGNLYTRSDSTSSNIPVIDGSDGSEKFVISQNKDYLTDITTSDDGLVVASDASGYVMAYNPDTRSVEYDFTVSSADSVAVLDDGRVAVGGSGTVRLYNPETGTVEANHSLHGSTVRALTEHDGNVVSSSGMTAIEYDFDSGGKVWEYTYSSSNSNARIGDLVTDHEGSVVAAMENGGTEVKSYNPDNSTLSWSHSLHTGSVMGIAKTSEGHIASGAQDGTIRGYDYGYDPTQPVTGTVEDQTGAPVSSATVEVWGTYSSVGSISDQKAELDSLADPTPPGFDSSFDAKSELVENSDVSGDVPLVYSTEEIGATAYSDGPSMETPRVQVPSGEPFAVVRWNPSADSGLLGTADAYERQLKGEPSSGKVKIERLGPGGDATDTLTVETDERISSDALGMTTRLQYAEVSLSPGYYEVTSINEDGQNYSYQMQVGSGDEILNLVRDDLEDTQEQLSDRAQQVRDAINNERVYRTTVTTDSNGQFSAEVPSGVQVVQVQAYSAGGVLENTDPSNRSLAEARSLADSSDYTGKWYISQPTRVEAPASGVTVTAYGYDSAPNQNMTELLNQFDSWEEFMDSEYSDTALAGVVEERLENRTELEDVHNELADLREENQQLRETVDEKLGNQTEWKQPEDATDTELREQIEALEESIAEMESTTGGSSDVQWNDDGTVDYSFETDAGLLDGVDSYSVLAISPNGETQPVPDEYVSASGDTVSVEGYPVPSDQSAVKFRLVADAGEEIAQDATRAENPAFSGDVPALSSVSVNTNIPQVGETVTAELNPEDEFTYGGVQSATVYGPNGEVNASVVDGQTVRFTPQSAGEHDVRVTYTNSGGTQFTESVTLQAKENAKTTPPSVRIVDGTNSRYALASGVEAAEVETVAEGSQMDVTVQLERGEIPSQIDVYTGSVVSGAQQEIDVQVVEGPEQSAVSEQIAVRLHTGDIGDAPGPLSEGAVVERVAGDESEAIPRSGGAAGDVTAKKSGGATITTYTSENGGVTVSVDNNPDIFERMSFWASQQIPDLPSLPFGAVSVSGDGFGGVAIGGIGLAGLFARRRGV